jgi:hypothetical protein
MLAAAFGFSTLNQRRLFCAWGGAFQANIHYIYSPQSNPGFSSGDCLCATGFSPLNAAASRGAAVTILGAEFGAVDMSPSAYISGQLCATTSWTSATQLICSESAPTVAGGALPSVQPSRLPR